MTGSELFRPIKLDRLPVEPVIVEATAEERVALAERFGLPTIHALRAEVSMAREGDDIAARGRLTARYDQLCAIANTPFTTTLEEPLAIRFVPALNIPVEDEEIEFVSDAPDEIEYTGAAFDLGEAVAQSLGLAIDPYAIGPDGKSARQDAGLDEAAAPRGPFAALAALRKD